LDRVAEIPPEQVGEVVAEHRADRARDDHEREADLALRGEDAAGDHRGLAREERDHRVEEREREDD
jgi:hypothetical protein